MKQLREPLPQKRVDQIPIIAFKNGVELFEVSNYKEVIERLRPYLSCRITDLRNAVWDGAFKYVTWQHDGQEFDFRTSEERQRLGVIKR